MRLIQVLKESDFILNNVILGFFFILSHDTLPIWQNQMSISADKRTLECINKEWVGWRTTLGRSYWFYYSLKKSSLTFEIRSPAYKILVVLKTNQKKKQKQNKPKPKEN